MEEITDKQEEFLDFLFRFHRKKGFPPTLDDAAAHFQLNKSTMKERRNALFSKGYIQWLPRVARTMEVKKLTPRLVQQYKEEFGDNFL